MIRYIIMSFVLGFTGNKLFNKKDKSTLNSIKWGCITGSILTLIDLATLYL